MATPYSETNLVGMSRCNCICISLVKFTNINLNPTSFDTGVMPQPQTAAIGISCCFQLHELT